MSHGDGLARLRQALEEHGCTVRGSAAQCPAPDHDDRNASLSIDQGRDGAVLNCHAGCATDVVLDALGMSAADLFDESRAENDNGKVRHQVTATYAYTDEHGSILFAKDRFVPKTFRIKHPDGHGGWTWGLGDARRVLYNLPAVLEAIARDQIVYVTEGEKDADRVNRAGGVATCNFEGAADNGQRPKWRPSYGDMLKGARVVVVADNDPAGRAHAAAVAADLNDKAASVQVVVAAVTHAKADVSDHLDAGYKLGDLVPVEQAFPSNARHGKPEEDTGEPPPSRIDQLRAALLDSKMLDSLPDPQPVIDGVLYADSLAWLHGKPGHGKSFVALDWAACVDAGLPWQGCETRQGTVLYVIAEGVSGLRQRVRAWEEHAGQTMGVGFLPIAVQLLSMTDVEAFTQLAAELEPVLIVVDTQARVTVGADENSARDMGELVAAIDRIRQASRACVLLVHHEARGSENMRGSTALEGAANTLVRCTKDGAYIRLENAKQKDAPEFDPVRLKLTPVGGSVVCTAIDYAAAAAELTESEQKIVTTMREAFGDTAAATGKLLEVSGVPKASFYRALKRMTDNRAVTNVGTKQRPLWLLPELDRPVDTAEIAARIHAQAAKTTGSGAQRDA
jgi:hypothetical protein